MNDRDVRKFNERADRYETDWLGTYFHRPVQQTVLEIGARLAPAPKALLDVGCGTGSLLRMAAQHFPDAACTGVDPAQHMIEAAVAAAADQPRLRFQCAPAEKLPFGDDEFDLVLSTDSFHNWIDKAAGMAEVSRVLAPGGRLVLADPFAIGWLRAWDTLVRVRNRMRTKDEIGKLLTASGLRCTGWEKVFSVGPITFIHAVTAQR